MYRYFLTTFQKDNHLKKIKCHKTAKLGWALAAWPLILAFRRQETGRFLLVQGQPGLHSRFQDSKDYIKAMSPKT